MLSSVNRSLAREAFWYNALTLVERVQLNKLNEGDFVRLDANDAQKRLNHWKAQVPFESGSLFVERLAVDGISESEFFQLLGELPDDICRRIAEPPDWLTQVDLAFTSVNEPVPSSECLYQIDDCFEKFGFLEIIRPLIHKGYSQLYQGCQALLQEYPDAPFDIKAVGLAFQFLPESLLSMLGRTLTLEMNVSRLQSLLQGDTPQARFQDFVARLKKTDVALAILQEYPVLARQVTTHINYWVTYRLEVLQHLCIDWQSIRSQFCPDFEPGVLVAFKDGAGDTHKNGRSVVIMEFSSGFQVVYKPKSLDVDVHFQDLLNWLNKRGNYPSFRLLKVISRGRYGWVEYVSAAGCSSVEEVQRFYYRQGCYLALLHVLGASDFHNENLIAEGEHPVLVDLETLFQPHFSDAKMQRSDRPAVNLNRNTVLNVGLLPQRLWSSSEHEGIDFSGLSNGAGDFWPDRFLSVEAADTDEMQFVRKRLEMSALQNQATLAGAGINVQDYVEELVGGFSEMYGLMMQYRAELLSEDGPLALFAKDEVRIVVRSTRTYGSLLYEGSHPDLLRDGLERDRFFDKLWLDVRYLPILARIIGAEHKALLNGDVPVFTTYPDSLDLWSCTGEKIDTFFDQSGMARVHQRLRQLNTQDLNKQLWIIRSSIAILSSAPGEALKQMKRYSSQKVKQSVKLDQLHGRLLTTASRVGDRLEELALHDENGATWLGLDLNIHEHWEVLPLGVNLYNGVPGVAFFLAYLGKVLKKQRYTALAKSALATLQIQLEDRLSKITSIGAFEGLSGIIYTLLHLGALWNREDLIIQASELVEQVIPLIEQDDQLDIIGGAAGCIRSLLSLNAYAPSKKALVAALQCGNHLIAQAKPMPHGIGWATKSSEQKALAGFSHGVAGISWTLLELSAVSGEEQFRATALQGLEYERSLFMPQVSNWPNLQRLSDSILSSADAQESCMTAWCHGAPGIGLARLQMLPYLEDDAIRTEINTSLSTTLTHGFDQNHCLCHGDLGNLELFLQASLILKDPQLNDRLSCLTFNILESIDEQGFLCGVPMMVETPDLMVGLAGIGYELLRLAEPSVVPALLTLEPPRKHSA
jgi:type 2 lantibiotic biosynthesis protein LanM